MDSYINLYFYPLHQKHNILGNMATNQTDISLIQDLFSIKSDDLKALLFCIISFVSRKGLSGNVTSNYTVWTLMGEFITLTYHVCFFWKLTTQRPILMDFEISLLSCINVENNCRTLLLFNVSYVLSLPLKFLKYRETKNISFCLEVSEGYILL